MVGLYQVGSVNVSDIALTILKRPFVKLAANDRNPPFAQVTRSGQKPTSDQLA